MTAVDRALQAAFGPIEGPLVAGKVTSVGTTPVLLFDDLPGTPHIMRRIIVANEHPTQDIAIIVAPLGSTTSALTSSSAGVIPVLARSTFSGQIRANMSILVVASGAATNIVPSTSDI